jgi:hypothetical protein
MKNYNQFINEHKGWEYDRKIDKYRNKKTGEEVEYEIIRTPMERMEKIPEDVIFNDYIKDNLMKKGDEYFYTNDYNETKPIIFTFDGDDILIYPDGKYKLIHGQILPGDIYFDIRYPNSISQKSEQSPDKTPPFGFYQWCTNNVSDSRWLDANDAFIKVEKID